MITYQLIYKHDIINYTSKQIITLKQIGVQLMRNACSSEMYVSAFPNTKTRYDEYKVW